MMVCLRLTAFSNVDCVDLGVGVPALLNRGEVGVVWLAAKILRARTLSVNH